MTEDLLLTREPAGWTARFALRVTSAVDLTRLAGYHNLTAPQRFERARAEDAGYLTRLSHVDSPAAFEFRWLAYPDGLVLVLLGRVTRATRSDTEAAAAWARAELAAVPAHVRCEPAIDIHRWFVPFHPHPQGIAEIRRRCLLATPQRPDAGVPYYLAVAPFHSAPHRWPALLDLLSGARVPTMLSVGIEPLRLGPELGAMLSTVADRYATLAQPALFNPGGLYSGSTWLPADPFAITAERLYRDAARRLHGAVFRLRVTVATESPLPTHLAPTIADLLSSPDHPCVPEPPSTPMDLGVLLDSLSTLCVPTWGGHEAWRSQPRSLRLLTELADPTEAASTIWLPATTTGPLPGIPITEPDPASQPAGAGVHFHNSTIDIHGDVIGRDKR